MVQKDKNRTIPAVNGDRRRRLWVVVPSVAVLLLILILSSQSYTQQDLRPLLSGDDVQEWLMKLLHDWNFSWNGQEWNVSSVGTLNLAEFLIRKTAHLIIYACLSFTLLFAFWVLLPWGKLTVVCMTTLLSLLIALFDEFNQQYSEARTPRLSDVVIDMYGVLLGLALFFALRMIRAAFRLRREKMRYRSEGWER